MKPEPDTEPDPGPGTGPGPARPERPELGQVVAGVQRQFSQAGLPSPAADAFQLVAHALGVDRHELSRMIVLRTRLDDDGLARLAGLVARRVSREPLQHLVGRTGFRNIEILVGPGVFVPRAETELSAGLAVEAAAELVAQGLAPLVVDLCSGSGAIALSVADEVPQARVVAVELSADAVAWARRSLERLEREQPGLAARVELRQGDAGDAQVVADLLGAADVVVANPPYIPPDAEPVEPEVRDHDPAMALYGGGTDGLEVPGAVVLVASALLKPGGLFVMEHGDRQGGATRALVSGPDWQDPGTQRDLTGRDRALVVRRAGSDPPNHAGTGVNGRAASAEVTDSAP